METDPLPYLNVLGRVHPASTAVIAGISFIVILLFLSALISGSEMAYFVLNHNDRLSPGKKKDKYIASVLHDLEKILATILVARIFVNVAIVMLIAHVITLLTDLSKVSTMGFIFLVGAVAFILLSLCRILPRVYAGPHAVKVARLMALPLQAMERIFKPLNALLIYSSRFTGKRVRRHRISPDDLSQALESTSNDENYDDKGILEGIVKFGSKNVAEIMRSRGDVLALNINESFEKVINLINESGYSRIPVYSGSFDNVRGILYIKDLLPVIHDRETFHWPDLIRPPFYVPETKKIDELLEEFQKNKVHMAVVVDELGGSSGIVTLEDILEEIVGDIQDEFDEDEHFD